MTTPVRRPHSVRRTTHLDAARPNGPDGLLVIQGAARDLSTQSGGEGAILRSATLDCLVNYSDGRRLVEIRTDPPIDGLGPLIGRPVASGFRAALNATHPMLSRTASDVYLLLDDLPGTVLVSGQVLLYEEAGRERMPGYPPTNTCAGWRESSMTVEHVRATGSVPVVTGPPAPMLERLDDGDAWHTMTPNPAHMTMRRRRRIDVYAGDPNEELGNDLLVVDAMFRDSHTTTAGLELVIHEYTVSARIGRDSGQIESVSATPRVLPWLECPAAAASVDRLTGRNISDLRLDVRSLLSGAASCTHLNDALRSLTDVSELIDLVR